MHSAVAIAEKNDSAIEIDVIIFKIRLRFESRKVCLFPVMKKIPVAISVSERNTVVLRVSLSSGGRRRDFCLGGFGGSGSERDSSSSSSSICAVFFMFLESTPPNSYNGLQYIKKIIHKKGIRRKYGKGLCDSWCDWS